jgi:hypothetical protein
MGVCCKVDRSQSYGICIVGGWRRRVNVVEGGGSSVHSDGLLLQQLGWPDGPACTGSSSE